MLPTAAGKGKKEIKKIYNMLLSIKVTALAGDDLDQFRLPSLLNAYFSFRAKC